MNAPTPKTLYDKIWESHLVHEAPGEASVHLHRPPSGA